MHLEHYIPVRHSDLVALLARDASPADESRLRKLSDMLAATLNFEHHGLLRDLKDAYAPFDPDATTSPALPGPAQSGGLAAQFCERFCQLLERANFRRLDRAAIEEATRAATDWGLNMQVDFDAFERLEVFYRGDTVGERTRRRWYRFFRKETVRVSQFQRLVLVVKLKPSKRLPRCVDTSDIFIKLFKDIPKMDVEMLLPGARLVMPMFSRMKMGGSFLGGLGYLGFTIFKQVITAGVVLSVYFFWGPVLALLGYGYRQYYGYQTTKNAFNLQLTESLYYQTLGNNLGVVHHLIDEAEEQECREVLLGYFVLWQRAPGQGWTEAQIDAAVEEFLARSAGISVDFEVDDALVKLQRLRLVWRDGDRWHAVDIEEALRRLDEAWDGLFAHDQLGAGSEAS